MNNKMKILTLCAMAVVLNVVLGEAVSLMKIPLLFLDTMGTIYISTNFGMSYGIMTGISTNLLMGIISGPLAVPFVFVNIVVAIICSLLAKNGFSYKKALIAGGLLAVVCPMIGVPIRLALFGGFTGSGTDILIFAFKASGKEMITATYWATVAGNIVDKMLSCLLVAWFMKRLPQRILVK